MIEKLSKEKLGIVVEECKEESVRKRASMYLYRRVACALPVTACDLLRRKERLECS